MLDSIYRMTIKITFKIALQSLNSKIKCFYVRNVVVDAITFPQNL